eukprot:CAMPEP_0176433410 /NCGR_PEP_ID=MMETSP0127-20121128/16004_1 /TAXON_ID=938130 /ORGANISM="Platyophrya macrostoma, Strain WH" /LENGTH=212 /DNA_ID=CAMNT_0017815829 /DNA_START=68 /DNA_END=706 /DNA_ORIENTATION=+
MSNLTADHPDEVEKFLAHNNYLSGCAEPNATDAAVFKGLKQTPNRNTHPNLFSWFLFLSNFSAGAIDSLAEKKATTKTETKKADAEDDLFGDDDPEEAAKLKAIADKKKADAEAGKKKKEVVARSIVIFDVKVFEMEQNLDELAKKILAIEMPGLQWRTEYKLVEIAYGMKKLQMGCTIEDEKIPSTDDIFDQITAWEDEVQSIDIVSFQKV